MVQNIDIHHGDTIEARVKCINSVQLESPEAKSSIVVSTEPPTVHSGELSLIPNNDQVCQLGPVCQHIQTQNQDFDFSWDQISDNSGIDHYELCINGGKYCTYTGLRRTARINYIQFPEQRFMVEVKGVNVGNLSTTYPSLEVNSFVENPTLSGDVYLINYIVRPSIS